MSDTRKLVEAIERQAVNVENDGWLSAARRMREAIALICDQEARIERLEAVGRTLADTLRMYGYPVSDAHWRNASGQMSAQARALHLAAESFRAALEQGNG